MKQLKFGDIIRFAKELQRDGMTLEEIQDLPIYIGDDDELNGIHCAWYTNLVDANDKDNADSMYFTEMINEEGYNIELTGKAILIS